MPFPSIKVSKLDAARRQLDCAVDLWSRDGDSISVHTLTFAAFEILQDLNRKKGNTEVTLLAMCQRVAKPEHVEDVMRLFRAPMTFFKHADRDPHGVVDFRPEINEFLFIFCVRCLEALGEQVSDLLRATVLWNSLHRPNIFLGGTTLIHETFNANDIAGLKLLGKREFVNGALAGYLQAR